MGQKRAWIGLALVLVVPLAPGCIEDFDPASRIQSTRILGARVAVDGAPDEAWPRPGQSFELRWLVAAPGPVPPLESVFLACPAAPVQFGMDTCGGAPALAGECAGGSDPTCVRVDVPVMPPAEELLVAGVLCENGAPELDLARETFGCAGDGATGTPAFFTVHLRDGDAEGAGNLHPVIMSVTFDGDPLPEPAAGVLDGEPTPCPAGIPVVAVDGATHEIGVTVTDASLETFSVMDDDGSVETLTEEIQISHFVTAGELDRQFSLIDVDDRVATVEWAAPTAESLGAGERVVEVLLVARDGRGGMAWSGRALCVR